MENLKELVKAFYTECLTVGGTDHLTERLNQLLADDFESRNAAETKSKRFTILRNGLQQLPS